MVQQHWIVIVITLIGLYLVAWMILRRHAGGDREIKRLLKAVSSDALVNVYIPDGLGGEIHLDHLLLTPHGLILLEVKDIQGAIFAGDRLDTWSATLDGQRTTFVNPIPVLHERLAALQLLAPDAPIESRVLFVKPVTFPKGHPESVSTVSSLIDDYAAHQSVHDAADLQPHWQSIKSAAVSA